MRYPAYPRYKPSGIAWLGDVPEHWEVKRGRFVMNVNPITPRLRTLKPDDGVSFVPMEAVGVQGGLNLDQSRLLQDVSSGYTEFQDGDVVVAKITPCFENGKGAFATGLLNGAAYGTTELHVLRSKKTLDQRFLFYLTISDTFRKLGESEMYGAGGQKRVPPEFNKDFRTPLPPIPEQKEIVDFLDRETGRIDTLMARKRELIERLKEKRTALISQTVTRGLPPDAACAAGLDPHPKLKPSGIEWLEDIPAHWDILSFRRFTKRLDQGWSPNANQYPAAQAELGVLKLNAVSKGKFHPHENKALDEIPNGTKFITPIKDNLLISRSNTPDLVGEACVVSQSHPNLIIPDLLYQLQLSEHVDVFFVCWFLLSKSGRAQIESDARGSSGSMVKLGQGHVYSWIIPIPPLPEQTAIADYLDTETAKVDALIDKVEEAIERLQEYRTALITAAVTGKIDVRGAAT